MSHLKWDESLSLGIGLIDDHHRHLFDMVNRACDMLKDGSEREETIELLNGLVDYATYHFAAEEYWMKRYAYPGLDDHVRQHEDFCIKVVEQELQYEAGNHAVLPVLVEFLSEWLTEHIQKSDGAYGQFARSIGASHDHDHLFDSAN